MGGRHGWAKLARHERMEALRSYLPPIGGPLAHLPPPPDRREVCPRCGRRTAERLSPRRPEAYCTSCFEWVRLV